MPGDTALGHRIFHHEVQKISLRYMYIYFDGILIFFLHGKKETKVGRGSVGCCVVYMHEAFVGAWGPMFSGIPVFKPEQKVYMVHVHVGFHQTRSAKVHLVYLS